MYTRQNPCLRVLTDTNADAYALEEMLSLSVASRSCCKLYIFKCMDMCRMLYVMR